VKYCVVIMDGASGLPLSERGGKTCLELASTPNLDTMVQKGILGIARTIPPGMEPSSSNGCMSVLGYDPKVYRVGRAAIEARSMGIPVDSGEVVFRCNLVTVIDGRMHDYSAGHISNEEAHQLIKTLNETIGSEKVQFYPGLSYRHIVRMRDREDTLSATCTPPHDIPNKPITEFMPHGPGSEFLVEMMEKSKILLREHQVNVERQLKGKSPANMIWLFWGSTKEPDIPSFRQVYGLDSAVTSAVDVIRGLAQMIGMKVLEIPGVTDGMDNDFAGQVTGALSALESNDLVVIHIEAPDEEAHAGSIDDKVEAISIIDREVISRLSAWRGDSLRALIMPDHPTPIEIRTHSPDPVPFMLWGEGFMSNGAKRFTEVEAKHIGLFVDDGYKIMNRLVGKG
jgi:2,3-bisphosphoglycerate-independent phosphoglycerate mutase